MTTAIYIITMAVTTYLIRMIPLTFFRKKIKSRFIKSFLYYIPYAVLSAMTIPYILYSTGSTITAIAGTVIAVILAYLNMPLIIVAISASLVAFLTGIFLK